MTVAALAREPTADDRRGARVGDRLDADLAAILGLEIATRRVAKARPSRIRGVAIAALALSGVAIVSLPVVLLLKHRAAEATLALDVLEPVPGETMSTSIPVRAVRPSPAVRPVQTVASVGVDRPAVQAASEQVEKPKRPDKPVPTPASRRVVVAERATRASALPDRAISPTPAEPAGDNPTLPPIVLAANMGAGATPHPDDRDVDTGVSASEAIDPKPINVSATPKKTARARNIDAIDAMRLLRRQ